jgi:hypothetical protein
MRVVPPPLTTKGRNAKLADEGQRLDAPDRPDTTGNAFRVLAVSMDAEGADPIENLTGNFKRKFQFMIVSFDTIFLLRLAGHAFVHHGKEYQIDRPPP